MERAGIHNNGCVNRQGDLPCYLNLHALEYPVNHRPCGTGIRVKENHICKIEVRCMVVNIKQFLITFEDIELLAQLLRGAAVHNNGSIKFIAIRKFMDYLRRAW